MSNRDRFHEAVQSGEVDEVFDGPDPDRPNAVGDIQAEDVTDEKTGTCRIYRDACDGQWIEADERAVFQRGDLR